MRRPWLNASPLLRRGSVSQGRRKIRYEAEITKMPNNKNDRQTKWWAQLNIGIAGDVGPYTCWTTQRGKTVFMKRAPPDKPPSEAQLQNRLRFQLAFANWKLEPEETKAKWTQLCFAEGLCMSGHNLYISMSMRPEPVRFFSACQKHNIELELPQWVPA